MPGDAYLAQRTRRGWICWNIHLRSIADIDGARERKWLAAHRADDLGLDTETTVSTVVDRAFCPASSPSPRLTASPVTQRADSTLIKAVQSARPTQNVPTESFERTRMTSVRGACRGLQWIRLSASRLCSVVSARSLLAEAAETVTRLNPETTESAQTAQPGSAG